MTNGKLKGLLAIMSISLVFVTLLGIFYLSLKGIDLDEYNLMHIIVMGIISLATTALGHYFGSSDKEDEK